MIAYPYVIVNKTLNFLVTDARDTMVLLREHQFLRYIFEIWFIKGVCGRVFLNKFLINL